MYLKLDPKVVKTLLELTEANRVIIVFVKVPISCAHCFETLFQLDPQQIHWLHQFTTIFITLIHIVSLSCVATHACIYVVRCVLYFRFHWRDNLEQVKYIHKLLKINHTRFLRLYLLEQLFLYLIYIVYFQRLFDLIPLTFWDKVAVHKVGPFK